MSETPEGVRVTLRLPVDLHAAVLGFAQGDRSRPRASLNATLVFLISAGLDQQRQQQGKGPAGGVQAPRDAEKQPDAARAAQGEGAGSAPAS